MTRRLATFTLALTLAVAAIAVASRPAAAAGSNCVRDSCGGICCTLPNGKVICTGRICV